MLRTLRSYLRSEVGPRKKEIARGSQVWLALVAASAVALFACNWGISATTIGAVVTVALAYAAVAFGFCLAGLTVALTLPNERFVKDLATRKPSQQQVERKGRVANAYSDLLFVFSWTAVAHWAIIVFGLNLLVGCGYSTELIGDSYDLGERIRLGLLTFFILYALFQFLITVITLSQVGNRYIDHLRGPKDEGCAPEG
jgi:hypothetical protein